MRLSQSAFYQNHSDVYAMSCRACSRAMKLAIVRHEPDLAYKHARNAFHFGNLSIEKRTLAQYSAVKGEK